MLLAMMHLVIQILEIESIVLASCEAFWFLVRRNGIFGNEKEKRKEGGKEKEEETLQVTVHSSHFFTFTHNSQETTHNSRVSRVISLSLSLDHSREQRCLHFTFLSRQQLSHFWKEYDAYQSHCDDRVSCSNGDSV